MLFEAFSAAPDLATQIFALDDNILADLIMLVCSFQRKFFVAIRTVHLQTEQCVFNKPVRLLQDKLSSAVKGALVFLFYPESAAFAAKYVLAGNAFNRVDDNILADRAQQVLINGVRIHQVTKPVSSKSLHSSSKKEWTRRRLACGLTAVTREKEGTWKTKFLLMMIFNWLVTMFLFIYFYFIFIIIIARNNLIKPIEALARLYSFYLSPETLVIKWKVVK